jgi:hypothetical protein
MKFLDKFLGTRAPLIRTQTLSGPARVQFLFFVSYPRIIKRFLAVDYGDKDEKKLKELIRCVLVWDWVNRTALFLLYDFVAVRVSVSDHKDTTTWPFLNSLRHKHTRPDYFSFISSFLWWPGMCVKRIIAARQPIPYIFSHIHGQARPKVSANRLSHEMS